MSDYNYHLATMERVAARCKKAELVQYCARFMAEADKQKEEAYARASKSNEENERLKNEARNLIPIRAALATVLKMRGGLAMENPAQLSLLLGTDRYDMDEASSNEPEHILLQLLDNCDKMIESYGGNGAPTYDELMNALDIALGERAELLKRLGLTDLQWSMQGGASFADLET